MSEIWVWHITLVHRMLVIPSNSDYSQAREKIFLSPLYSKNIKYFFTSLPLKLYQPFYSYRASLTIELYNDILLNDSQHNNI